MNGPKRHEQNVRFDGDPRIVAELISRETRRTMSAAARIAALPEPPKVRTELRFRRNDDGQPADGLHELVEKLVGGSHPLAHVVGVVDDDRSRFVQVEQLLDLVGELLGFVEIVVHRDGSPSIGVPGPESRVAFDLIVGDASGTVAVPSPPVPDAPSGPEAA